MIFTALLSKYFVKIIDIKIMSKILLWFQFFLVIAQESFS